MRPPLCLWYEYRHLTATEGAGNLELANRSWSFPCPFDVESSARSSRAAHGQLAFARSFAPETAGHFCISKRLLRPHQPSSEAAEAASLPKLLANVLRQSDLLSRG